MLENIVTISTIYTHIMYLVKLQETDVRFGQSSSYMFNVVSACTSYAQTTYESNR